MRIYAGVEGMGDALRLWQPGVVCSCLFDVQRYPEVGRGIQGSMRVVGCQRGVRKMRYKMGRDRCAG